MSTPARFFLHQNKTWAENAIEHWLEMEPSDESAVFLAEIINAHRSEVMSVAPRRLRSGMVQLRRVMAKEKRRSRLRAIEMHRYYGESPVRALASATGARHG
ncbi:hypothetical protein [Variovorax sp. DAIF25]|uniref:hypothetical protein n=1 Tax=Variovorax sp. DAIF25 TaxID=3080983 RepID=UPI003D6AF1CC